MSAHDETEIAQISIYLAKPSVVIDDALDWGAVKGKPAFVEHNFKVGAAACKFVYFETIVSKDAPPWLEFANAQLPISKQIDFKAKSRSANGIIGIEIDGRLFMAAFGRSASGAIVRKNIERDFGIKAAMNLCGNEEIRQTRTQSNSITPTHIDRQVSRPSEAFVFGLGEAEDLKSISAHMKGDPKVTLQGRDHLTIKVSGSERLSWDKLIVECQNFLKAYSKKDFLSLFPNYRNFQPAPDDVVEKLDAVLLNVIKEKHFDEFMLWVPEFIPNDEFSFSYSDSEKRENRIYSYLDATQMAEELNLEKLSIKRLHNKYVYAYSHIEDRILPSKRWALYDCVVFEQKLGKGYYLLTDGEWKVVDQKFYESVVDFVDKSVVEQACEKVFKKISIADQAAMKNKEELFNTEVCVRRPQAILFDRSHLRIGAGRKDKEFCDILDLTDNGEMRIINCKPYKGSSAITYLFAQTRFYSESFVKDQTFLDAIRGHIENSTSPTKDLYLAHVAKEIKDVNGKDYDVCVWLLCDDKKPLPSKGKLPLIAKYELKLMHDHLLQVCKFKRIVLRFIPVEMAGFVRSKVAKAQVA